MEGKLYRYDLGRDSEQLMCVVDGYDWGFYPMEGGVAVYTDGDLSYYNALGARERTMYAPEAYAVLSGGGDAVIIYEPTDDTITYAFADGSTASASAGEPGFTGPATTATPEEAARVVRLDKTYLPRPREAAYYAERYPLYLSLIHI